MNPIIFERHHLKSTKLEIKKMFSYFFVIGSSGLLILSLFSKETIFLFTNEKYYGAEDLMPLMYITVAITGLGLFSPGINIEKKTKLGAIIIIGSALLNVVLNYFFILNWGAFGAASATLLSVLFFYVIYFLISQRYYKIPINFIKIFPFLFLNLAIIFFGCYIYQSDNWIEEIIMKIICSLFYIAVIVISFFRKKNDR